MHERRNSIANPLELHLPCANPSVCGNRCQFCFQMSAVYYISIYSNTPVYYYGASQITKFLGPTWGPPGSCRPQMGPMLAPWTLLLGLLWSLQFPSLLYRNNAISPYITFMTFTILSKPPDDTAHLINWAAARYFNSSPTGQNGRHFPDDIFKCIFMNEKFCILIWISLKAFMRMKCS